MLEVKNIDVFHEDTQALWDVSMTLQKGEILTMIGANGAGKSTIAETIAGLIKPAKGKVFLDGVRIDLEPVHRLVQMGISLVPENKGLFPGMSVLENLEMGAFNPKSREAKEENLATVYELFPLLKGRSKQLAGTLSGGEQQMLAIGRGMMSDAKVLILDEPSLGLAPRIAEDIFAVIHRIYKTGVSILLVEQNVHIALELAQRAYIIENGRVTRHGDARGFLDDEHVMDAYLGTGV
jgi:branched-chain amino acid transport system ATP-binding protein